MSNRFLRKLSKPFNGKRTLFFKNGTGELDIYMLWSEPELMPPSLKPVRVKTIELLGENTGESLLHLTCQRFFKYDTTGTKIRLERWLN